MPGEKSAEGTQPLTIACYTPEMIERLLLVVCMVGISCTEHFLQSFSIVLTNQRGQHENRNNTVEIPRST